MIKIMISGITGKMGSLVAEVIKSTPETMLVGGTSQHGHYKLSDCGDMIVKSDVIIDFSNAAIIEELLEAAIKYKKPVVIGTTGLSESLQPRLKQASATIPIFYSANFSKGICLLNKLISVVLEALSTDDYDIEVVESHHREKKDAPSGTAIMIGQHIADFLGKPLKDIIRKNNRKDSGEIGISSIRGGAVFGEHEVMFLGQEETLNIKHTVLNRTIFAHGAVKAAIWLINKTPGIYGMNDIL